MEAPRIVMAFGGKCSIESSYGQLITSNERGILFERSYDSLVRYPAVVEGCIVEQAIDCLNNRACRGWRHFHKQNKLAPAFLVFSLKYPPWAIFKNAGASSKVPWSCWHTTINIRERKSHCCCCWCRWKLSRFHAGDTFVVFLKFEHSKLTMLELMLVRLVIWLYVVRFI
jgi:hypothetical protein